MLHILIAVIRVHLGGHLFVLLLAEIELNLVQVEVNQFDLLDQTVHQAAALLDGLLPKLDHLSQSLAQGN